MNQIVFLPTPQISSQCERNNCQCPCHDEPAPWYNFPLLILTILTAVVLFMWFMFTVFELLDGSKNLSEILFGQWQWFKSVLGRLR